MDISNLKTFLAVVRYGSFRKAAGDFYISPRAVSKQMDQLEDELGIKLFERKKNRSELTEDGHEFIVTAEDIVNTYTNEINRINTRKKNQIKHLRLGFSSSNQAIALQRKLLPIIDKEYTIDFIQQSGRRLIELLQAGELDFIVTPYYFLENEEKKALKMISLFTGELVVGISKNSSLSKQEYVKVKDLEDRDIFYYSPVESAFMQDVLIAKFPNHFKKEQIKRAPSLELRDAYVASNQGIGFYPSVFVDVEQTRNPMIEFKYLNTDNNISYSSSLYYRKDANDEIKKIVEKLV